MSKEKATLGGGCFWCIEAVFQLLEGVEKVVSGYCGGHIENPSYREVCSATSGHIEVVEITFDSEKISYPELLEVFWTIHDPTTRDRQGNDKGSQYRSVIFYHNESQKSLAQQSISEVATQLYDDPIVTELRPVEKFYAAEAEHQDFYQTNPSYGYCRVMIDPKIAKIRAKFMNRIKSPHKYV